MTLERGDPEAWKARGGRRTLGGLCLALVLAMLALAATPGAARASQLRGAVLTPNFQWPAPNGVTVAQSDRETQSACALGSTVMRVVVNWARLEPGPGQFDPR